MRHLDIELRLETSDFDTTNLIIHRLRAEERMGQLFGVELEVVSMAGRTLDPDEAAGAVVSVSIGAGGEVARSFHGMVMRVVELPAVSHEHAVYQLSIRPHLWQATLVETLDVYLETTVPDVVEELLGRFDLAVGIDYVRSLEDTYLERELIVQYQESHLAFISRLCEHLGIFFYFAHDQEQSTLVLGDHTGAYRPISGDDVVAYRSRGEREGVYELRYDRTLVPGTYVCRDYHDQTPALELQLDHALEEGFAGGIIEYGGDFQTPDQGKRLARVRAEEWHCRRQIYTGLSSEPRFAPGHTFELEQHPHHSGRLLLTAVEHEASQDVAGWGEGTEEKHYENRFTAIPAELTYRPPRRTPVPRIHGVLSGVIDTWQGKLERHARLDEQGRYLVRFLFDTAAPGERKASSRVRMMQQSAGTGYGTHFPLKPGVEVLIGFVGGNPDRPVILGAVPNPITPTPVKDAEASKSRIKTRSGIVIEFDDANRGS